MINRWRRWTPWDQHTYWSLDLETSSLSPRDGVIVSVGMVPVRGGAIHWGDRYYSLVRWREASSGSTKSLAIHQILPGESEHAPRLHEVIDEVRQRLEGSVLLVHHAALDLGFLRTACRDSGVRWRRPLVVDTVRLIGRLRDRMVRLEPYPIPVPRGLEGARRHLGLPRYLHHHALADALATAELFLALRARLAVSRLGQLL